MTNEERSGMLGGVSAPPKLLVEPYTDGDVTCWRLAGTIDEQFDGPTRAQSITSRYLLLDCAGIERISSFGIRQWVDFIASIGPRLAGVYFVECSPKMVDQFNMVANFGGSGYIVSFYAPYRCDTCDHERRLLFRTDEETPLWKAGQAPPSVCPTCGSPEDFDEDPATYFTYIAQQPTQQIPREVMNFLRVHMSYGQGGQRKLKIEKRIDGRTTLLKLAGDLDSDLKAQKLADGLEGDVVVDLGGILSIDPVGTAQWRKLMQLLAAKTGTDEQVDRIHFLSVPATFLERLGKPEDLTPKGQVLSLLIPYNCSRCRAATQRLVDFVQHGDELRAGRVPRVKCGLCGGPVTCVVSEAWFSRMGALPIPQVTDELRKTISRLLTPPPAPPASGRASMTGAGAPALTTSGSIPPPASQGWQAQPVGMSGMVSPISMGPRATMNQGVASGSAPPLSLSGSRPQETSRTPYLTGASQPTPAPTTLLGKIQGIPGLLPGLLVVLLSLSGAVVYRILTVPPGGKRGASEWVVVEASQPKSPPWHASAYVPKDELAFVGHSPLVPDRTDALERADIAAQAALAQRLEDTIAEKYPDWKKTVTPLYTASLQAAREDVEKAQRDSRGKPDDKNAAAEQALVSARERLSDLQKRVASILKTGAADVLQAPPIQYWEKRARGAKSSREVAYQASSLIQLNPDAMTRLINFYGQSEPATQAKVKGVPLFPLLGYRYDPSVNGAIVVDVESQSPLTTAGLQVGDIVVAVAGRDVHSPLELSKLLDQAVVDSATKDVLVKVQRGNQLVDLKLAKKGPKKIVGPVKKGGK